MIHRAISGSLERFMAIAIEHFAGAFPTWLSPVQVAILPISEKQLEYAETIAKKLMDADIRFEMKAGTDSLGKRIREGKTQKIPYMLVIGDKEIAANSVGVESRDKGPQGQIDTETFLTSLKEEISSRR